MYSLLWSEHCAYKHSKKLLRTLPTEGPHVVMGPGENAGAVDVGGGLVCAFKVESHNHPSAVEPFQGAATGVGGILRDIFAIGARPIAVLDSLRFGEPTATRRAAPTHPLTCSTRARYLLDGAVAGSATTATRSACRRSAARSTSRGPTSRTAWSTRWRSGCASASGWCAARRRGRATCSCCSAPPPGATGSAAPRCWPRRSWARPTTPSAPRCRSAIPFEEKKLLECSLELLERGLLVALQDLGAAGLTSSAAEMASKGEVGIDIDVARVPLREPGMEPFEIMVSRVPGADAVRGRARRRARGARRCARSGRSAARRSARSPTRRRMRVFDGERLVGEMPVRALVDECPLYDLQPAQPTDADLRHARRHARARRRPRARRCWRCCAQPNIASRRPLFEQYDAIVQSRTVRRPAQADAAVLVLRPTAAAGEEGSAERLRGESRRTRRSRSASTGNGRRVAADPYRGTIEAVLECAANLACVGAAPLGTTNNLNFGNPEKPHIAWQLSEVGARPRRRLPRARRRRSSAATSRSTTRAPPARSTRRPVVGMVGRLPDAARAGRLGLRARGRRDRAGRGRSPPRWPRASWRSCTAGRCPTGCRRSTWTRCWRRRPPSARRCAAGVLSERPRHRRGRPRGRARRVLPGRRPGRRGLADRPHARARARARPLRHAHALFGEGPGGFVVIGPARRARGAGRRAPLRMFGTVERRRVDDLDRSRATLSATLAELAEAHGALAELFP